MASVPHQGRVLPFALSLTVNAGLLLSLAAGLSSRPPPPAVELQVITMPQLPPAEAPQEESVAKSDLVERSIPPLAETTTPTTSLVPEAALATMPPMPLVEAASELAPATPPIAPTAPRPIAYPAVTPVLRPVTTRVMAHSRAATPPRLQAEPGSSATPAPSTPASSPVAAPSKPPDATSSVWRSALATWLATHKRYPEEARSNGQEGAVGVMFSVTREGRVERVVIERPSGVPTLDRSVHDMLEDHVVPSFPADMPQTQAEVRVTIRFKIDR